MRMIRRNITLRKNHIVNKRFDDTGCDEIRFNNLITQFLEPKGNFLAPDESGLTDRLNTSDKIKALRLRQGKES